MRTAMRTLTIFCKLCEKQFDRLVPKEDFFIAWTKTVVVDGLCPGCHHRTTPITERIQ